MAVMQIRNAAGEWVPVHSLQGTRGESSLENALAVNVLDYGLVGDGVTDNSAAFAALAEAHQDDEIDWPSGIYCFTQPITVGKAKWRLLGATLKYTGADTTYFVRVEGGATKVYNDMIPWNGMYIVGNGFLDGSYHAGTVLQIGAQHMMEIRGLRIHSFTRAGMEHCYDGYPQAGGSNDSYELTVSDCEFYNDDVLADTIGVIADHDSVYTNLIVRNAVTAVKVRGGGNCFFNLHAWVFDFTLQHKDLVNGTTFVELWGTGNRFASIYSDTYQYSFVAKAKYVHCILSDMHVFWNKATLPDGFKAWLFVPYADGSTVFVGSNIDAGGMSQYAAYKFWEDASIGKNCKWSNLVMDGGTNAPSTGGGGSIDTSSFLQKVGGVYTAGGARLTALGAPTADTDAATKAYTDALCAALEASVKAYVDAAIEDIDVDPSVVPCESISLDRTAWSTGLDETAPITLTATVSPIDCTQTVTWTSSNAAVAAAADGVVTAVGAGSCTITARCGRKTATCAVTVTASRYIYLAQDMTPDGGTWTADIPEGFSFASGDAIEVQVDTTTSGSADELLLVVGQKPDAWIGNNLLFYGSKANGKVSLDCTRGDYGGTNKQTNWTGVTARTHTITINQDGVYWDGESKLTGSEYSAWAAVVDEHGGKAAVGTEGGKTSAATYAYIRVKKG